MLKNKSGQKLVVFAFDYTTGAPKSGDSANITAYVSIDFGAVTVLTDTTATEMDATNAKGYYLFDLTQAETNGNVLQFSAKSSTANVEVIASPATVFTTVQLADGVPHAGAAATILFGGGDGTTPSFDVQNLVDGGMAGRFLASNGGNSWYTALGDASAHEAATFQANLAGGVGGAYTGIAFAIADVQQQAGNFFYSFMGNTQAECSLAFSNEGPFVPVGGIGLHARGWDSAGANTYATNLGDGTAGYDFNLVDSGLAHGKRLIFINDIDANPALDVQNTALNGLAGRFLSVHGTQTYRTILGDGTIGCAASFLGNDTAGAAALAKIELGYAVTAGGSSVSTAIYSLATAGTAESDFNVCDTSDSTGGTGLYIAGTDSTGANFQNASFGDGIGGFAINLQDPTFVNGSGLLKGIIDGYIKGVASPSFTGLGVRAQVGGYLDNSVMIDGTYDLVDYIRVIGSTTSGACVAGSTSDSFADLAGNLAIVHGTVDDSGNRSAVIYNP